jgi:DNA-binding NtrC family response regulator/tetratricopeptide (TPR) repeat protein
MAPLAQLIGDSPGLVAVRKQVEHLLQRQSETRRLPPILILGETGTGKGLFARALHDAGPRKAGAFVAVNCAAIPETLLEAELFGYERGAFTDAREAKAGLFQTAHRGTLFLDEIGLLPQNLQPKLLTALEDRAVRRLGSTRPEPVDVWIISATSEDLKGSRRRGFREELYHRLAVVTLRMPPLRDRGRDILTLAEHFLARTCSDYGLTPKTLAEDARAALLAYRWPGNVRELGNAMERAALLVEGPLVRADGLQLAIPGERRTAPQQEPETTPGNAPSSVSLGQTVEALERRRILEALRETGWNISRAATRLGVTRNILRYRVQKYGLGTPPATPEQTEPCDDVRDAVEPTMAGRPPRVQWERRHVALLRADLVSGTSMVVSAAGTPLEVLVEKIESFGGQVEEVSPGGLVAVFALEPVEDAPRRAAHAALAIQRIAARARESSAESPGALIGLHVDEVLIGRVGSTARVEHATKREVWQQLEALMAGAEAGTVLISEATYPFLARRFVLAPYVAADGPARTAHRLVGLERTGLGLGERLTPFVARSQELNQLARAFEQARTDHGQVVTIVGEPGVGKSRLFWEFIESHRGPGALILVSGAASHGKQTPYLPVIDLLKAYFQIELRDDADKVRERVTEKVLSFGSALAPALPALLAVLDVPGADVQWQQLDPQQKRRRTLEAVKLLLLEESRRQPVIVVLEDLHWVDSETQAVLDTLVESLPSHRVLLLVSCRPEYQHAWGGKTYYTQLRLDPLSREDAHALLDHLLGGDEATAALKTKLIDHTERNPFFLEEGVRTLVETGVLAGDRGDYRLARTAGEIRMPATVQAVLAARIDRLSPQEKALLHVAAVIGKDVPLALLRAVADLTEESLHASLVRLQRSEFLYETRFVPEVEYAFKHALSHEVAYASLLEDRRRVLHARIMATIEQLHANHLAEQVDRLARHAFQGEVWDKAAIYGRQAGEKAAARSAYREAVARFEQALEALTYLPETRETIEQDIDLRLDLRDSLSPLGERQRSFDHLRAGEVLAERIGDQGRMGWISAFTAAHFWEAGEPDRAVEHGQRALAVAHARGNLRLEVVSKHFLGQANFSLGEFRRALECFQSIIQSLAGDMIRERFGGLGVLSVRTRLWLVHVLTELGDFAEGISWGQEGVEIAETVGQPLDLIAAHRGLGYLYLQKGDLSEAIRFLERSRELSQTWDIQGYLSGIIAYLGYAHVLCGRLGEGLALLAQGHEKAVQRQFGFRSYSGYAWSRASLGEAYGLANREEDAIRTVRQALDYARDYHRRAHEAWVLRALGEIALHRDPPDTESAGAAYRQAMALADELGMRPIVAHCHHGLGKLYGRVGKCEEAREHLAIAATMYREMEMRFWLDRVETAASRL